MEKLFAAILFLLMSSAYAQPPTTNAPYKRYVQISEGTHTVIMEKNRMQLFQAVQQFLDEQLEPSL